MGGGRHGGVFQGVKTVSVTDAETRIRVCCYQVHTSFRALTQDPSLSQYVVTGEFLATGESKPQSWGVLGGGGGHTNIFLSCPGCPRLTTRASRVSKRLLAKFHRVLTKAHTLPNVGRDSFSMQIREGHSCVQYTTLLHYTVFNVFVD